MTPIEQAEQAAKRHPQFTEQLLHLNLQERKATIARVSKELERSTDKDSKQLLLDLKDIHDYVEKRLLERLVT